MPKIKDCKSFFHNKASLAPYFFFSCSMAAGPAPSSFDFAMASCLTRQMTTARPCRFLLRIVCRALMRFNLLDALAVLQLRGCQCAETPQILQLFPTQTKKKTGKKKESKDMADIETQRTQKRFPCMSHCPAFGINFTSLSFTHSSLANQDSEETLNRALHGA